MESFDDYEDDDEELNTRPGTASKVVVELLWDDDLVIEINCCCVGTGWKSTSHSDTNADRWETWVGFVGDWQINSGLMLDG